MAAQVVKRLPEGDDWIYELKFDGYRALIIKDKQRVELRSRKNKDLSGMYRGIAAAGLRLKADQAVVDGEIVALDAQGSPSFQALQHRGSHPGHQIVFYAFDLLHLDGTDLTGQPLLKRRARLARVLDGSGLLPSQELPGTAAAIVEAVRGLGLEGVIAKRKDSLYEPGERSDAWQKLKLENQQEFVIGGYRPAGSNGIDALLVGYYDDTGLRFAGKVRAGFVPHLRREVFKALKPHHVDDCPFVDLPQLEVIPLGRRRDGRRDAGDAVGEAGAGGADTVRGVDGRGSAEARGIPGSAPRQERARGAARSELILA